MFVASCWDSSTWILFGGECRWKASERYVTLLAFRLAGVSVFRCSGVPVFRCSVFQYLAWKLFRVDCWHRKRRFVKLDIGNAYIKGKRMRCVGYMYMPET